jgi:hypothetical protein
MSLILSGTDGLSEVDGSAATPAIRGTDANTGIFFPAADTIAFSEGGAEAMRINSSGQVGIGTSSPDTPLTFAQSVSNKISLYQGTNWHIGMANYSSTNVMEFASDAVGEDITFGYGAAGSITRNVTFKGNGNLQFNSGYGSVATAYGCRAWVNFNGQGTVAIRGSGNVSSITDNGGSGDYTVNFTTAMPDINYCSLATGTGNEGGSIDGYANLRDTASNKLVGSVRVQSIIGTSTPYDTPNMNVAIFR